MHIYTVFLPSSTPSAPGAEEAVFVRQGFNRSAFLFTPLWALRHGYWLALALWLAWVLVVVLLASYANLPIGAAFALYNIGAIAFGLEADRFGEANASRKGFVLRGLTLGDSLGEAESLYFVRHLAALQPETYDARLAPLFKSGGNRSNMTAETDLLGLFQRETWQVSVAIIDYGSGNLHSAAKAFERAAQESGRNAAIVVTSDPDVVRHAEHIVLPGVGAFADCRRGLLAIDGMVEAMTEAVEQRGAPFLGICVGMQLLADRGLEHGVTPGLGWIGGEVVPIEPKNPALKIPHMGWNNLSPSRPHALLDGIPTGERGHHAYFVHSYHLRPSDLGDCLATTDYGDALTAMVGRDTIVGVQFHPEKSQTMGLRLIGNFLRWRP